MIICGIDEAGRGPLAGPVCAAAVILPMDFPMELLKDSKKTTAAYRQKLLPMLLQVQYSISWSWPSEIDRINIHHATLAAMKRAYEGLNTPADKVLIDGKYTPQINSPAEAVIGGDSYIPQIQAASIIAKEARDRWMIRYSWIDDRYSFEKHKGYPTKLHRERCNLHGISAIHRKSFRISSP
jgi:ribonuclease HII